MYHILGYLHNRKIGILEANANVLLQFCFEKQDPIHLDMYIHKCFKNNFRNFDS